MMLHLKESLGSNMPVSPPHIPLCEVRIFFYFELEFFWDSVQDFVLTISIRHGIPDKLMKILSKRRFAVQLALNLGGIGSWYLVPSFSWRPLFYFSLFFLFIWCYIIKWFSPFFPSNKDLLISQYFWISDFKLFYP